MVKTWMHRSHNILCLPYVKQKTTILTIYSKGKINDKKVLKNGKRFCKPQNGKQNKVPPLQPQFVYSGAEVVHFLTRHWKKKTLGLRLKLLFRVNDIIIHWVYNNNYFTTTMVQQSMYSLIQIITDSVKQFFGLLNFLHFPETKKGKCMLSLLIITSSKDLNSFLLYECNSCKQILTFNMHDWLHPVYFGFFPLLPFQPWYMN